MKLVLTEQIGPYLTIPSTKIISRRIEDERAAFLRLPARTRILWRIETNYDIVPNERSGKPIVLENRGQDSRYPQIFFKHESELPRNVSVVNHIKLNVLKPVLLEKLIERYQQRCHDINMRRADNEKIVPAKIDPKRIWITEIKEDED